MRETLQAPTNATCIEAREAVEKWGDLRDWHHAIGTGPFILNDFISGDSATLIKNPDYWGHDERYPQNQLPYVDKLKFRIIPMMMKRWTPCARVKSTSWTAYRVKSLRN